MSIAEDWQHAGDDDTETRLTDEEIALDAAHKRADDVAKKVYELQIRDAAQRKIRADERAGQPKPARVGLDDFLNHDYGQPTYRVTDLWPTGGRVLLTAQWKAGKTTLVGNTIRALVDAEPFLDRYPVTTGAHVVLIDDELNEATLQAWLRDQDIKNTADVSIISLRGRAATFDILDDDTRTEWAQLLTGSDVIIFDCLRPVLDALGLDENHEAGRFLVAFDTLLAEAGAGEALIVHHMGHHGERSRGDSRLQDWPDALWKVVRDKDDEDDTLDNPTGSRYFSAFGRDVDVRQSELTFDPITRHLTLGENAMNRPQATAHRKIVKADEAVIAAVAAHPGINKTTLRKTCAANHGIGRNEDVDSAVERLVTNGLIVRHVEGNTHRHYPEQATLTPVPGTHVPNVSQPVPDSPDTFVPPPLKGANGTQPTTTNVPGHHPTTGHKPTWQPTPEHDDPAPTCTDCGWPLDHQGHASYCEETR